MKWRNLRDPHPLNSLYKADFRALLKTAHGLISRGSDRLCSRFAPRHDHLYSPFSDDFFPEVVGVGLSPAAQLQTSATFNGTPAPKNCLCSGNV